MKKENGIIAQTSANKKRTPAKRETLLRPASPMPVKEETSNSVLYKTIVRPALRQTESAFNCYIIMLFHLFLFFLFGNGKLQDTMLEAGFNISLFQILANIEGTAAGSCVTFTTDIFTFFISCL